nr:MAG TPA: hypothetical protein [Caudoviricetes sp.]
MEKDIKIFGTLREGIEFVRVVGRARRVRQLLFFLFLH